MKTFAVKTQFVFDGVFRVKAENKQQAIENIEKHCGAVIGNIHSSLSGEYVDWEFDMHPKKVIVSIN